MYKKCQLNYIYSPPAVIPQIIWGTFLYQNYYVVILTSQQQIIGLGIAPTINAVDKVCHDLHKQLHGLELTRHDQDISKHFDPCYRQLALTINMHGTPFQHRVWQVLHQIPYGQTSTYQHIARLIGQPKAARAVGQAVGRNPVSYLVPCHRVRPASAAPGHFRWGDAIKYYLLQAEIS